MLDEGKLKAKGTFEELIQNFDEYKHTKNISGAKKLNKKKYHLITSANELTWKFDRPVVFLGEWCRLDDRKHVWQIWILLLQNLMD